MELDQAAGLRHWPADRLTQVPYWLFSDPGIFEREQERIYWGASWNYLALESELANAGDFKTTFVGMMPVIVVRDTDGAIRAFENRCSHRGALLCLKRSGNTKDFSGLNPHAGEKGLFGREEIEIIGPGIESARALGILAEGPSGADTLLGQPGYDAFVAMLHDQGHVAAKIAAPRRIVGQVVGAPLLFASVGHGTAMDIAGRGVADPEALIVAILSFAGPR